MKKVNYVAPETEVLEIAFRENDFVMQSGSGTAENMVLSAIEYNI